MAGYNQEFRSRLIADGFAFLGGQHESVGKSLTFRVSAYSRDQHIGEEIRYYFSPLLAGYPGNEINENCGIRHVNSVQALKSCNR